MGIVIVGFMLATVGIAILVALVFWWRKQQLINEVKSHGWEWLGTVEPDIITGLNHPPFGIGLERRTSDVIRGTSQSGTPFLAFTYKCDAPTPAGRTIMMLLPTSLPAFYVFPTGSVRPGVSGYEIARTGLQVVSAHPEYGKHALDAISHLLPQCPVGRTENSPPVVDLSIDHNSLVIMQIGKTTQELAAALDWGEAVRAALLNSPASQYHADPPPPHLSFYGHPNWRYVGEDDNVLDYVDHTHGGHSHTARDIIVCDSGPLPFIRLTHRWVTTTTTTDSKGNTRVHNQTHVEHLLELQPAFPFVPLAINNGRPMPRVKFESEDFNRMFRVCCADARFASNVIHPQMMEWLLHNGAPSFTLTPQHRITLPMGSWQPDEVATTVAFFHEFFRRVPRFVWQNLGTSRPTFDEPALPPGGVTGG